MRSTPGRVLVLNAGSATLKATVLDLPDQAPRFEHTVEWVSPTREDVDRALEVIANGFAAAGVGADSVTVVGHRVVHGGESFTAPTLLDDEALHELDALADLAPLHNPIAIATIRAARARLRDVPHVAAFDTAFHATLPVVARRYPIPDEWVEDHRIRRFGFHGLSVDWAVGRAASLLDRATAELRIVVAHLGGGSSVTAVDRGRSVDTSMGLTPLEGLMMTTRAGSIDPGIVFRLIRDGIAADEIERRMEHESGLLAMGGTTDMRRLLEGASAGDPRSALAIDMFVARAAAGIAAAMTSLRSLDALVFTGGIGQHAGTIRSRICDRLIMVGIPRIPEADVGGDAILGRGPAGISVLKVRSREDLVIAAAALTAIGG